MKHMLKARKLHRRRKVHGMDVSIETQAGAYRHWYDPHSGESGKTRMKYDYGYVRGTEGTDGDHVDVFIGPNPEAPYVYVINQMKKPDFKTFDEQKVMVGFDSAKQAKKAYLAHYDDERFFGSMKPMSVEQFKAKVMSDDNQGRAVKSLIVPLEKAARPAGKGWQPIPKGRKGGFRRRKPGGKGWEYWYPEGTQEVSQGPKKPKRKGKGQKGGKAAQKPSEKPRKAPGGRMPSFEESRAPEGSALGLLEQGHFRWTKATRYERSEDGHMMRKTRLVPGVDDQSKLKLLSEFEPLIKSESKKAQRRFGLKNKYALGERGEGNVNETIQELNRSGTEGLLQALNSYQGGRPFAPFAQLYVKDYTRMHAAREFLGMDLPARHSRNLQRYIAARAEASRVLGNHDPSPEDVLPFFDLRKKHVHADLPAFDEKNKEVRNAQIPDREGYKLGLGRKGKPMDDVKRRATGEAVDREAMRDVVEQPSKLDWAKMYDGFLRGQKGMAPFEEQAVMPGVGMGYGFSPEDQVVIRNQVAQAMDKIDSLKQTTLKIGKEGSRKKPASYQVPKLSEIVLRRLGVGHKEHTIAELADEVPIYKKMSSGDWKVISKRSAQGGIMQRFVEEAMDRLSEQTKGLRAENLVERAKKQVAPPEPPPKGPSYGEMLEKEAKDFSSSEVKQWREKRKEKLQRQAAQMRERAKYGDEKQQELAESRAEATERGAARVDRMSDADVRYELAKESRRAKKTSEEMRKLMTNTMEVERVSDHEGVATMFDPSTGRYSSARIRMTYQDPAAGPESEPTGINKARTLSDKMIRECALWPEATKLLIGDNQVPTTDRFQFETMIGAR